jgi:protein TonB
MTAATAEAFVSAQADPNHSSIVGSHPAQSLLRIESSRPNYPVQAIAVILYAIAMVSVVTFAIPTKETTPEEPLELVVVPSAADETPPPPDPLEQAPPPEAVDGPPPPPEAIDPIAPITPPKPVQKPVAKPVPNVEKQVERRPTPPRPTAAPSRTGAPTAASSNPNATQSLAANQFLACMQRAASRAAPDSPIPKHGRVAYRASFSPSGSMTSFNITPSGNALLDGIASRLGSRCGSLPAIGHPFNVSGGVVF